MIHLPSERGKHALLKPFHSSNFLRFLFLIGTAAICYLPFAHQFGFYRDDWYLVYVGVSQGAAKFTDVFAIDRPFRAPFVSLFFNLLGLNPPLYSYTGFIARIIGAASLYWIIRQVWSKQPKAAWIAALLFIVYPGFLDMPAAFDFQTHFWAFGLGMLSIALSIKAVFSKTLPLRISLLVLSAVLQAANLLLMEYFIGIEGLRLALLVYLFVGSDLHSQPVKQWVSQRSMMNILRCLLWSSPALLVNAGFMLWRQFFFQGNRAATDVGGMISGVVQSPLLPLLSEPVNLIRDLFNVIIAAWAVPAYDLVFRLRLRDSLLVLGLALLAALLVGVAWRIKSDNYQASPESEPQAGWGLIWVGLIGAAAALLPVHLGDRQVIFSGFSRFAWTASAGGVLVLTGLAQLALRAQFRQFCLMLLIAVAAATHNANALQYTLYTKTLNSFWWQVSWRIPQMEPGTMLAANYAGQPVEEDYFIWGPANLIYYPDREFTASTPLAISAMTLAPQDVYAALSGQQKDRERRGTISHLDVSNLLVLSMPTPFSCVHVINGALPELTETENPAISLLAPHSHPEQILVDEPARTPPVQVFGIEPDHGWCYYYTMADLARQRGDWKEVARLGDEASTLALHPIDGVEALPFVQAYAVLQRETEFKQSSFAILENIFLRRQACQIVQADSSMAEQYPLAHDWLLARFCRQAADT